MTCSGAAKETANATGVSESTIYRIKKQAETTGLDTPPKRKGRPKRDKESTTTCTNNTDNSINSVINSVAQVIKTSDIKPEELEQLGTAYINSVARVIKTPPDIKPGEELEQLGTTYLTQQNNNYYAMHQY